MTNQRFGAVSLSMANRGRGVKSIDSNWIACVPVQCCTVLIYTIYIYILN